MESVSPVRKPLILQGSRQVGKTYILKEFGKREYQNLVYINCDNNEDLLRQYYFTGGMPEAVACYLETQDIWAVRAIQEKIIETYRNDISKHARTNNKNHEKGAVVETRVPRTAPFS